MAFGRLDQTRNARGLPFDRHQPVRQMNDTQPGCPTMGARPAK
jgi:hypothetical protein